MVARIRSGKDLKGAVNYNEKKVKEGQAELIAASGYSKQIEALNFYDKVNRLQRLANLNTRTETHCLHLSVNFDPAEKLSAETLQQIAIDYMTGIGFKNQPFLVYQHFDAAHQHIHIVSTNIQRDGKRISLHNLGRVESERTRKEIEVKFGLKKAGTTQQNKFRSLIPVKVEKAVYGKVETKKAISNIVIQVVAQYKFASLPELNAVLRQFNVTADRGVEGSRMFQKQGLQYSLLDDKGQKIGVPIKASSIQERPTLKLLEAKFVSNIKTRQKFKRGIKLMISETFSKAKSLDSFTQTLSANAIDAVYRTNAQNFIYGVTYVDHRNKTVFNGSELGKEYAAAAILEKTGIKQGQTGGATASAGGRAISQSQESNVEPTTDQNRESLIDIITESKPAYNYLPFGFRNKRKRKFRKL